MIELFRTNTGSAAMLALLSFAAGVLATCLVCKFACKGGCCKKQAPGGSSGRGGAGAAQSNGAPRPPKRSAQPADGSIEIYVGNLSYDLTEERLRKEFEAFGTVNSARIITNRYNGKSKGFGFVHMPNADEVKAAIAALSEKDILGRKMRCNVAKNS